MDGELTEWSRIREYDRDVTCLSICLMILEATLLCALQSVEAGVNINGQIVDDLRYADDIDLITQTAKDSKKSRIKGIVAVKDSV